MTGKLSHTRPSDLTSTIEAYLKGNGEEVTIFVGQDERVCRKRAGRDDVSGRVEW